MPVEFPGLKGLFLQDVLPGQPLQWPEGRGFLPSTIRSYFFPARFRSIYILFDRLCPLWYSVCTPASAGIFKKNMLTIRLTRVGKKKEPSFRVIVVESKRKPQTGNYLEMVGSYDARSDRVELNGERIKYWMGMGATVSDTLHNLLVSNKIIEGKKINVLPKKTVPKKEEEKVEEPAAEAAAESAPGEVPLAAEAGESAVAAEAENA